LVSDLTPAKAAQYLEWLAPEERNTHGRFVTAQLAAEYLVARALVRWTLSQYEPSVAPRDWRFERTAAGRPFITGPRRVPSFNLTHAGGLVACAVSACVVGVDTEPLGRGAEILGTMARVFSAREAAELAAVAELLRPRRAVDLWTLKEAYLKARGDGIKVRLERISIACNPTGGYALDDVRVLDDEPHDWQLAVRDVADSYVVAIAVRRRSEHDLPVAVSPVVPA
jgi:4'-phosphopantetheinyl transferase